MGFTYLTPKINHGFYFCTMFLFHSNDIQGDQAHFNEIETRHCVQVLRKTSGDAIQFVDGEGGWYHGNISSISKKHFTARIEKTTVYPKPAFSIHLAIAPTKNIDRFEWFLEKATEFGIEEVTPIICENSERRRIRPERLEKILLSAMKQSLKPFLPKLNELVDFEAFIKDTATNDDDLRFIAHCRNAELPLLRDNCPKQKSVTVLIGPEGDFSMSEIELALANGFNEISLGKSRLRTETAGIAAVHTINLIND